MKEFDFNIKLLSLFKAEREKNELTNHIIKKLQEKQISNSLNLPDLSNMSNQQMPYSRIPRGLGVSRGGGRGMILPAQIPPMPNSNYQSINGYIKGMIKIGQNYMNNEKTKTQKPLIIKYKKIIKSEANKAGLPPEMIAGLIYNEAPKAMGAGNREYELKELSKGNDATTGIVQVSPYSSLVEKTVGFNPSKYNNFVKKYNDYYLREIQKELVNINNKFKEDRYAKYYTQEIIRNFYINTGNVNSKKVNNIYELKNILRDYYKGKIDDPKVLKALSLSFGKSFSNNKEEIKHKVTNEVKDILSDEKSIHYVAQLLSRVSKEKGFLKGKKWTDEEIKAVVHEYNKNSIPFFEEYDESIYNNLNNLRIWLK